MSCFCIVSLFSVFVVIVFTLLQIRVFISLYLVSLSFSINSHWYRFASSSSLLVGYIISLTTFEVQYLFALIIDLIEFDYLSSFCYIVVLLSFLLHDQISIWIVTLFHVLDQSYPLIKGVHCLSRRVFSSISFFMFYIHYVGYYASHFFTISNHNEIFFNLFLLLFSLSTNVVSCHCKT